MTPLLALSDVGKSYWRGSVAVRALRSVSLVLHPGDFVGVWGALGSGKTTLLRLAAGLEVPDEGDIRFEGRRISARPRRELQRLRRREIAFGARSGPVERELAAVDYVAFPLMGEMSRAAARRCAMDTLCRLGLEPPCGALRWTELTDGERTLVTIAHAIVREPKLLLVDDPTSNLGVHERERTIALLHRLAVEQRMAVLMTAPDPAATLGAHAIYTLSGGELLAAGPATGGELVHLPGA